MKIKHPSHNTMVQTRELAKRGLVNSAANSVVTMPIHMTYESGQTTNYQPTKQRFCEVQEEVLKYMYNKYLEELPIFPDVDVPIETFSRLHRNENYGSIYNNVLTVSKVHQYCAENI